MCLVGQPLLSVLSDAPQHFISGSRINRNEIHAQVPLWWLHFTPVLFSPPTSNCIYSKYVVPVLFICLFIYFLKWQCCHLIHFQVLYKGCPFCLIPGLSNCPLASSLSILSSSAHVRPSSPSLVIWANRVNNFPGVSAIYAQLPDLFSADIQMKVYLFIH